MENEIVGVVVDIITNNSRTENYSFLTVFDNNQELYWKISNSANGPTPKLQLNQNVTIIWDNEKYMAYLKVSEIERMKLVRDFSKSPKTINQIEKIEVLKCNSCGSNVPLGVSYIAECEYCGAKIELNNHHLASIKTSLDVQNTNKKLFDELNNLFDKQLTNKFFKLISNIPLILFSLQVLIIAHGTFFRKANDFFSDEIVGEFFMEDYNFALFLALPSLVLTIIIVFIGRKNAFLIDIAFLYNLFAPTVIDKKHFQCRNCGSPLKNNTVPEFIPCPYCRAENIVLPDKISLSNVSQFLKINYLIDIKILHSEFKIAYKKYFIGILIGLLVFAGSFVAFTFYLDEMRHVDFLVKYIAMPFIVLIMFHLLSEIALLPFAQFDDWIPKYFSENMNEQKNEKKPIISFWMWLIPIAKFSMTVLFIVTLFFMK